MKIYIAGKITGDPNYKDKFQRAEKLLVSQGHIVLNPAILPEGMQPKDYMDICFAMIRAADQVVFIPDCFESEGARLEYNWCCYTGKPKRIMLELE